MRASRVVILLTLVACGRDRTPDGERARTGPLPMDTVMAALQDYHAKRIGADSTAVIISRYIQRTGRVVNFEMDADLLAAMQRQAERRAP